MSPAVHRPTAIRTPDQRLRVFVSSTLEELAPERAAVRSAVAGLRFTPVMFELGARPHNPRDLYRAYLSQSHLFIGIYWQRYGWVGPEESMSGIEDEYRRAGRLPKLIYVKSPAPAREPRLDRLLERVRGDEAASYKAFSTAEELGALVEDDVSLLVSERFEATLGRGGLPEGAPVPGLPAPSLAGLVRGEGKVLQMAHLRRCRDELSRAAGRAGVDIGC